MKATNKSKPSLYELNALIITSILFEIIMYILTPYIAGDQKIIIPIIFIYFLCILFFIKKNKENNLFYIIFAIGILLRTAYILSTDIYVRQHDVGEISEHGHLAYIYTLYQTHHLPLTNEWQFYHPPLWHIIGALWLSINNLFHMNFHQSLEGLQILPLLFSSFMIIIVDKINLKLKISNKYRYLIDLIFAIHPTLIYFSGSINNDCLLLFLESLVILLLVNFSENSNWHNIIYLAIVTGLCVMDKMNGAVMSIPILYIFIDKFIYIIKHDKKEVKPYILKILTFGLISLPIGLWFPIRNIIKFSSTKIPEPGDWLFTGNHSILSRFFTINIKELFHYANMAEDYNLPSFIIKSSLFGEYKYENINLITTIMLVLNILLIIISLIFTIKYLTRKSKNKSINILLITGLSFIVAMYLFNYNYPFACSMDFRYIAICLIPGIIMLGYGVDQLHNLWLKKIIGILSYTFVITNIIFISLF